MLSEKSADEFWQIRLKLFEELGEISTGANVSELESSTKAYFLSHINKDLICWGVSENKSIISTASLCLFERIPYQENMTGREGYILNVYTCPEFRNQGLAKLLINRIIEYASENGINRLWLHSSEKGKGLYLHKGFIDKVNEMELFL